MWPRILHSAKLFFKYKWQWHWQIGQYSRTQGTLLLGASLKKKCTSERASENQEWLDRHGIIDMEVSSKYEIASCTIKTRGNSVHRHALTV